MKNINSYLKNKDFISCQKIWTFKWMKKTSYKNTNNTPTTFDEHI